MAAVAASGAKKLLSKEEDSKLDESASSEEVEVDDKSNTESAEEYSADDKVVQLEKAHKPEVGNKGGEGESSEDVDEKDEEEKEIKVAKKRDRTQKKAKVVPAATSTGSGRERKQVERFSVPVGQVKKGYEQDVDAEGIGEKLGDMPYVTYMINKTNAADLMHLYQICFGKRGKHAFIKKHLRNFSGFPFDSNADEFQKRKASSSKWPTKVFRQIFSILGLKHEKNVEGFVPKLLEFCLKPEDSGKNPPNSKSKRSSTKKAGEKRKSRKSSSSKSAHGEKDKAKKRKHDSESEDDGEKSGSGGSDADEPKTKRSKQSVKTEVVKKLKHNSDSEETVDESESEVDSDYEKKKKAAGRKRFTAPSKSKAAVKPKPKKKESKKPNSDSEDESDKQKSDEEMSNDEKYDIAAISDDGLRKVLKEIIKSYKDEITMKIIMDQVKKKFKVDELEPDKTILIKAFVKKHFEPKSK